MFNLQLQSGGSGVIVGGSLATKGFFAQILSILPGIGNSILFCSFLGVRFPFTASGRQKRFYHPYNPFSSIILFPHCRSDFSLVGIV